MNKLVQALSGMQPCMHEPIAETLVFVQHTISDIDARMIRTAPMGRLYEMSSECVVLIHSAVACRKNWLEIKTDGFRDSGI